MALENTIKMLYNDSIMGRNVFSRRNLKHRVMGLVSVILIAAFMMQILPLPQISSALTNEEYDAKIKELQGQVDGYRNRAAELALQSETLNGAIAQLQLQQDEIQAEIDLNNAKLDKLNAEITENEIKMKKQSEALARSIAAAYITGQPSSLEVLANSNTLNDYINSKSQEEALQAQLNSLTNQINRIKKELQVQKYKVETILQDQTSRRDQIAASKQRQQELLSQTKGQEAEFQRMVKDNNREISRLRAEQEAANRAAGIGIGVVAGDPNRGGYPDYLNNAPQDALVDPWGMYNRECVSYTAWKVYQSYGNMPYWGGHGNANQWVGNARAVGIPTGSTPKVGSVGATSVGVYGHVVWVEAVSGDGSKVYVSQYNVPINGRWGMYSEQWIDASKYTYIYFGEWNR